MRRKTDRLLRRIFLVAYMFIFWAVENINGIVSVTDLNKIHISIWNEITEAQFLVIDHKTSVISDDHHGNQIIFYIIQELLGSCCEGGLMLYGKRLFILCRVTQLWNYLCITTNSPLHTWCASHNYNACLCPMVEHDVFLGEIPIPYPTFPLTHS